MTCEERMVPNKLLVDSKAKEHSKSQRWQYYPNTKGKC